MTVTHTATSVWNDSTWQRIAIEPVKDDVERDLSQASVSAADIGGSPGQPVLVELLNENGDIVDSREIKAT